MAAATSNLPESLTLTDGDGQTIEISAVSQEVEDRIAIFGNQVGGWVLGVCALLVALLVGLLWVQTLSLNQDPTMVSAPYCAPGAEGACQPTAAFLKDWKDMELKGEDAARVALEYDAQFLRTKRAQSLVSARLFVWSIAILAGISQLTMGSAFIFARIRSSSPEQFGVEDENGRKAYLSSLYPGVILSAFGALIIGGALLASTQTKHETYDMPVYMDWPQGMRAHRIAEADARVAEAEAKPFDLGALKKAEAAAAAARGQTPAEDTEETK